MKTVSFWMWESTDKLPPEYESFLMQLGGRWELVFRYGEKYETTEGGKFQMKTDYQWIELPSNPRARKPRESNAMLPASDVARKLNITTATISNWRRKGLFAPDEVTGNPHQLRYSLSAARRIAGRR